MKRVNCFTADCSCCKKGVKVGETFLGSEPLYVCEVHPKKHKNIDAEECGAFRCNNAGSKAVLCQDCRKGK